MLQSVHTVSVVFHKDTQCSIEFIHMSNSVPSDSVHTVSSSVP